MTIRFYPAADYVRLPWKNGAGRTDEICLLPDGATRDRFEIRVSSAPITSRGRFSAFPGADRVITLIEGRELALEFERETVTLKPFQPCAFDTGLAPVGNPGGGAVRVVNMMANRAHWAIADTRVLTDDARLEPGPGGLIFVIALDGPCHVQSGKDKIALAAFDSALVEDIAELTIAGADGVTPRGIAYILTPAT